MTHIACSTEGDTLFHLSSMIVSFSRPALISRAFYEIRAARVEAIQFAKELKEKRTKRYEYTTFGAPTPAQEEAGYDMFSVMKDKVREW